MLVLLLVIIRTVLHHYVFTMCLQPLPLTSKNTVIFQKYTEYFNSRIPELGNTIL